MNWDLTKLYKDLFDDPAFINDIGRVEDLYKGLIEMAEKLTGPADLAALINEYNAVETVAERCFALVHLTHSANVNDENANKYMDKLMQVGIVSRKLSSILSRFMADKDVAEYAAADPVLKEHEYMLTLLKREAQHVIDPALEDTVLRMQLTGGRAWSTLRGQLEAGCTVEFDGEKKPLSYIRGLAYSPDADVRKRAYEAELAAYPSIATPMAACLNGIKGEALTLLKLKNYDSVLDTALDVSRMDQATLDALLQAMHESLPAFRRYYRSKAKKLGYEGGLKFYDMLAPVGKAAREYTVEEARSILTSVFSKFSKKLSDFVDNAFADGWIDMYPREGKSGGAFCSGTHCLGTSYVLTNFDNSYNAVSILGHELGHAYHSDCVKHKSILMSDYPMPLAETASIFNETLLSNKILETADDDLKLTMLEEQIANAAFVIVDILSRYLFEYEVIERRKDHTMTAAELCEIMIDAQKKTFGDGMDENCLHPYMWACKTHYYSTHTHFYNFPYAFGLLFGLGVYAIYQEKGDAFVPEYDELLAATSAGDVRDVAASVGIDVADVNFWRKSVKVIEDLIDEYVKL